jgi:hypothetical protein
VLQSAANATAREGDKRWVAPTVFLLAHNQNSPTASTSNYEASLYNAWNDSCAMGIVLKGQRIVLFEDGHNLF